MVEGIPHNCVLVVRTRGQQISLFIPLQAVDATSVTLQFCLQAQAANEWVSNMVMSLKAEGAFLLELTADEISSNVCFCHLLAIWLTDTSE